MPVEFTNDQKKAIDLRNSNILVSAAAGSGKTAVLVERIVKLCCLDPEPVDIDRLLVVTFTRAAAAQMRERVSKRIRELLTEHPENAHIRRQYSLVHRAQITTIDSFCLSVLQNHFQEIGIDPGFRICDDAEGKLLKEDVLQEVMERAYARKDPAFLRAVEQFGNAQGDAPLQETVLRLFEYSESFPWPDRFLEECLDYYEIETVPELQGSPMMDELLWYLDGLVDSLAKEYHPLVDFCYRKDGPQAYTDRMEQELEAMERFTQELSAENLRKEMCLLLDIFKERMPSQKKTPELDEELKEQVKAGHDRARKSLETLWKDFFVYSYEEQVEMIRYQRPAVEGLINLTRDFSKAFAEKKREKHIIDFSDQEHFALQILVEPRIVGDPVPTAVAEEYRSLFAEILIDEYQDSNRVQETILSAISGEEIGHFNRFMVGDVKQSIYSFRQACPDIFMEKYDRYVPEGDHCRIDLKENYRSRSQVLDLTNAVFSRLMNRTSCDIAYDDNAALHCAGKFPDLPGMEGELMLFSPQEIGALGREWDKESVEALVIATRILELVRDGQITHKTSGDREIAPLRFGDIVILHRSPGSVITSFSRVFESLGIPFEAPAKTGYFASKEVCELLQFLRTLNNPHRDISLYGAMISVFGGFSEEDVARIRAVVPGESLADALAKAAEDEKIPVSLQAHIREFTDRLDGYRKMALYTGVRDLLQRIYDDYDYPEYLAALPCGARRKANAELFLTRASAFEQTSYYGLNHFIRYMDRMQKYNQDMGQADVSDDGANVVRMMSIHQSKGLEFPVVIVAGLSRQFNEKDINNAILWDGDLGIGCTFRDRKRFLSAKPFAKSVLALTKKHSLLAEELRVLYVAMTRAEEKLILSAAVGDVENEPITMELERVDSLPFSRFLAASCYYDFLRPICKNLPLELRPYRLEDVAGSVADRERGFGDLREKLEHSERYAEPADLKALEERFELQYPYGNLEDLYTKTSVSELKMAALEREEEEEGVKVLFETRERKSRVPAFRAPAEEISGTVRGNAYHRVMQLMDFDRVLGAVLGKLPEDYAAFRDAFSDSAVIKSPLETFLAEERESGRLSQQYLDAVRKDRILTFLGSELSYRMWRAQRAGALKKEQPFVYGIPADRLEGKATGETLLIQGIIDVYFIEDGKVILADYKTDAVEQMKELWDRYRTQMDYYAEALSGLTGLPVAERYLYSFRLGCAGADETADSVRQN